MKFKSKYNVGDIVHYFNTESGKNQIGRISRIFISYNTEFGEKIKYDVERIKIDNDYIADEVCILEGAINKKINKKAFDKEYAKECVREMMKSE